MAHARLAGIPVDRIVNCWPVDRLPGLAVESYVRASSVMSTTATSLIRHAQRRELDLSDQMVWDAEQADHYARWTSQRRLLLDLQGVHSRDEALFAVDRLRRRP